MPGDEPLELSSYVCDKVYFPLMTAGILALMREGTVQSAVSDLTHQNLDGRNFHQPYIDRANPIQNRVQQLPSTVTRIAALLPAT